MKNKPPTRSPLRDAPLRNPGQSLDEELSDLLDDKLLPLFIVAGGLVALAITEWWRWYRPSPPHPWFMTGIAIAASAYCAYRIRTTLPKIRALRLGRDGEKVVGQSLEELRAGGAIVLHDIVANGFNVDHVVIASQGIFVIETKTWSKPTGRDAKVVFDGEKLLVDGRHPSRDPIRQVQGNAAWVRDLLKESIGKSYPVKPVVLFPGWYIENVGNHPFGVAWVLNPKALPTFLANETPVLTVEDVKTATCHLARYIRNTA